MELLHKNESVGGDNHAITWLGPGLSRQVVEHAYLSPWSMIGRRLFAISCFL